MRRTVLLLAGLLAAPLAAPVRAQEGAVTSEIRVFVDQLQRAGWTGKASANGLAITARNVGLCSQRMLDALAVASQLPPEAQAALADVARVTVPADGWLMNEPVTAGTYHLGLERTARYLRFNLSDAQGTQLGHEPIWIGTPTPQRPATTAMAAGGAATAVLTCGEISFSWRFIATAEHDRVAAAPQSVTVGRVTIHSDLESEAVLKALATECEAAIPGHARVLGVPEPTEPFHVHLYADRDRYLAADTLLTGGAYAEHDAFTSLATRRCYMWYIPYATPVAFADHGATHAMRALVLHELAHAVARRYFSSVASWPVWLNEGLAELATWKALGAHAPADGELFLARVAARWRNAMATTGAPRLEDLLGDEKGTGLTAFYDTAFLFTRHLDGSKPGRLAGLLAYFEGEPVYRRAQAKLTEVIETDWGPLAGQWNDWQAAVRALPPGPAPTHGHADRVGSAWRLISRPKQRAQLVWPQPLAGPDAQISCEFAFHLVGSKEVECFFGLRMGRDSGRLVKVAVLPRLITLWAWRGGRWTQWGQVSFKQDLTIGSPAKPQWYPLKVRFAAATRTVRVDTGGGRWAEFRCKEYVPIAGTHVALGCYDGACLLRGLKFE